VFSRDWVFDTKISLTYELWIANNGSGQTRVVAIEECPEGAETDAPQVILVHDRQASTMAIVNDFRKALGKDIPRVYRYSRSLALAAHYTELLHLRITDSGVASGKLG
jgi:hypothetical protein